MSDSPSLATGAGGSTPDRLTDRVIARIKAAHRDLQVRPGTRPARGARRKTDSDTRALRRVFRDMGEEYRSYRRRTGEPVSSEVRDAALRFRRELDLRSLVTVASCLQRVDQDLVG